MNKIKNEDFFLIKEIYLKQLCVSTLLFHHYQLFWYQEYDILLLHRWRIKH